MASELLYLTRGDEKRWLCTVLLADGTPVDITGATIWLTVKRNARDLDSAAVFVLSTVNGRITFPNAALGQFLVTAAPGDTDALVLAEVFEYDIQIKELNGQPYTWRGGRLLFDLDVTRTAV